METWILIINNIIYHSGGWKLPISLENDILKTNALGQGMRMKPVLTFWVKICIDIFPSFETKCAHMKLKLLSASLSLSLAVPVAFHYGSLLSLVFSFIVLILLSLDVVVFIIIIVILVLLVMSLLSLLWLLLMLLLSSIC